MDNIVTFQWKQPQIEVKEQTYGEYLITHPDLIPEKNIPLETKGYLITKTDYGTAKELALPFKAGDWIDAEYISENFRRM